MEKKNETIPTEGKNKEIIPDPLQPPFPPLGDDFPYSSEDDEDRVDDGWVPIDTKSPEWLSEWNAKYKDIFEASQKAFFEKYPCDHRTYWLLLDPELRRLLNREPPEEFRDNPMVPKLEVSKYAKDYKRDIMEDVQGTSQAQALVTSEELML